MNCLLKRKRLKVKLSFKKINLDKNKTNEKKFRIFIFTFKTIIF